MFRSSKTIRSAAEGRPARGRAALGVAFAFGLLLLATIVVLLRYAAVTDYLYHAAIKDPERHPPPGAVILAPADGTVLYVRKVTAGVIPEVVKRGVPVAMYRHMKTDSARVFADGWLIGIYMNGDSVHINRVPIAGVVTERIVFNGPHMDMTEAERTIMLTQLIPGWVAVKKLFGFRPYDIEDSADFVLKSARETLVFEDVRGADVYVTRIADYAVGKILTWVHEGEPVETGQRMGMITWGSQTDVYFESTPGTEIAVSVGQFVYGGETILATY